MSNSLLLAWKAREEDQYPSMRDWNIKAVINHQAAPDHGWQPDLQWPLDLRCHGPCDNEKTYHTAANLIKNRHSSLCLLTVPLLSLYIQAFHFSLCMLFLILLYYIYFLASLHYPRLGDHRNLWYLENKETDPLPSESLSVLLMLHCPAYDVSCVGRELYFEEEDMLTVWPLVPQVTRTAYSLV